MNELNYYFEQTVQPADMKLLQQNIHDRFKSHSKIVFGSGIFLGLQPSFNGNSIVSFSQGAAFDINGNLIDVTSDQNIDVASHVPTSNSRYISICAIFTTNEHEERTDGYGDEILYKKDASYQIVIIEGAIATSPVVPTLPANYVLLLDVLLTSGNYVITSGNTDRIKRNTNLVDLVSTIDAKIIAEALARANADTNLQNQISEITSNYGSEIRGFDISNSVSDSNNDLVFTPGKCANSERNFMINSLISLTKQFDVAFAEGNNAGGMDQIIISKTTTYRSRTGNIATLTLNNTTDLVSGRAYRISGVGGIGYNVGNAVITVINSTTITYPNSGANETNTADTTGRIDSSKGPNCTVFSYAISKANGDSDIIGSLSAKAPILPLNYIYYRLVRFALCDSSGNFFKGTWHCNNNEIEFDFSDVQVPINGEAIDTSGALYYFFAPLGILSKIRGVLSPGASGATIRLSISINSPWCNYQTPVDAPTAGIFRGDVGAYMGSGGAYEYADVASINEWANEYGQLKMKRTGTYYGVGNYTTFQQKGIIAKV